MHVLLSEDLKDRPEETTRTVFEFLGVDPSFVPSFKVYNRTWMPFSVGLQHDLRRRQHNNPVLTNRGRTRPMDHVLRFVGNLNTLFGMLRTRSFNPATRRELLNRYREDIRRTEQLLGRSLDIWLKDAR